MYHYISNPPADADEYRRDLSVSPANFEAQLAWLRSQGYQSITLSDLVYNLTLGWPLPDKPVIFTFDDGYRDNFTRAFPLLKKYGYVGTFFLVTDRVDRRDPAYVTWGMVKKMHRAGMDIQPHGYRHHDLSDKPVDFLVYEIVGAKEAVEARTGEPARFFSYPSGSYDEQTIAVLRSAYFWGAVGVAQGATHTSDGLFELSRIRIRGRHTVQDLIELINLDW
jgi:peptidoglycan/xylan/chitin deacetylase (PgdA/CDA1 family)